MVRRQGVVLAPPYVPHRPQGLQRLQWGADLFHTRLGKEESVMKHIRRNVSATRLAKRILTPATMTLLILYGSVVASRVGAAPRGAQAQPEKPADRSPEKSPDKTLFLKSCVGTWKASFQGEVFAVLVLKEHNGALSGTLNNFDVVFDKDGNLTDGTHQDQGDAPLLNVRVKEGALYFVVIQKDQYNPSTEWKFVPKSANEAELWLMLDNQPYSSRGITAKPIPMLREPAKR